MQIALIILKSGIELITMAEQLEEEPSCHMQDPYLIKDCLLYTSDAADES